MIKEICGYFNKLKLLLIILIIFPSLAFATADIVPFVFAKVKIVNNNFYGNSYYGYAEVLESFPLISDKVRTKNIRGERGDILWIAGSVIKTETIGGEDILEGETVLNHFHIFVIILLSIIFIALLVNGSKRNKKIKEYSELIFLIGLGFLLLKISGNFFVGMYLKLFFWVLSIISIILVGNGIRNEKKNIKYLGLFLFLLSIIIPFGISFSFLFFK